MSKIKHLHNVDRLRELFSYDPVTGILTRLTTRFAGKSCGTITSTGHMHIDVDGTLTGVHRVAWAIHYGEYPTIELDHINGNGADNRIINLRLATSAQNNHNRRLSSRNKTGIKGVFRMKWGKSTKWRVIIGHDNEYYIEHFYCFGQAIKHAAQMRSKFHAQFARAV